MADRTHHLQKAFRSSLNLLFCRDYKIAKESFHELIPHWFALLDEFSLVANAIAPNVDDGAATSASDVSVDGDATTQLIKINKEQEIFDLLQCFQGTNHCHNGSGQHRIRLFLSLQIAPL